MLKTLCYISVLQDRDLMIFEEKRWVVAPKCDSAFIEFLSKHYFPHVSQFDGGTVCLLRGMIGKSSNEFILISYHRDISSWESYTTSNIPTYQSAEIESSVLLNSISSDPLISLSGDTLKDIYGYREFTIDPKDTETFIECSEKGIWPRVRTQGGKVLGLWANLSEENPARILLLTGYDSVSHWEGTRSTNQYGLSYEHIRQAPAELTDQEKTLRKIREDITITTKVNLMKNVSL